MQSPHQCDLLLSLSVLPIPSGKAGVRESINRSENSDHKLNFFDEQSENSGIVASSLKGVSREKILIHP
jgi:hypothetical protein